ncbi:AI-2E family transporter [Nocardia terpenica]|uniref:AI-2E family transporter n=1 Tax=Nocardia terpenica TaxID=455432 RepID=UPI00189385D2|nr:AI-2E family transporter [Nocardia terpenica]MBF6059279.1 AI-2E family transporter [Nocardia terpenica]MBF6103182.1 AI-2E family transporter [Nocardia terpenica]MBF6110629.1 AI-2E family transporter [Nocardia terpenica]MBF6116760.1 AI-2E family transporter [Nocardia terpenica]
MSRNRAWVSRSGNSAEPPPMVEAEAAASVAASPEHPLGRPGARFDRRSPFMIGLFASAGVVVTIAAVRVALAAHAVLLLIAAALFLAIGLEPAVSWLVRHRVRRGLAVTLILTLVVAALAGFVTAATVPLVAQGHALISHAPDQLQHIENRYPVVRHVADKVHLEQKLRQGLSTNGSQLTNGVFGVGKMVFGALTGTVIVAVLTAYFSAAFPRLRAAGYRLFPQARRPRAILIGDAIFAKVGGYVLGNLLISLITGVLTFGWLAGFGVPYPLVLAVLVAVLDLVPLVGSTIAGVVTAAVALSVSLIVCLATVGFFIALRLFEDYVLAPRIMGRTVQVPGVVTVTAVLLGGALLGIVGAMVAIPVAAAIVLLLRETVFPRLDEDREDRNA